MIGNISYEEVNQIIQILKENSIIVKQINKSHENEILEEFISTVEGYSMYLETSINLNKSADNALKDLKK